MKPVRLALAILFCAFAAMAEDIYVSQNGDGTTNSIAWFNTAGNWGAGDGKISAGDTVYFVGVITNKATIQSSGSEGSPIWLRWTAGAKFSNPVWTAADHIIEMSGRSWLVLDGGNQPIIEATDNGTQAAQGGNCTYKVGPVYGIYGRDAACNHINFQNLIITNLYYRIPNSDDPMPGTGAGYCIDICGSFVTYSNCVFGMQDCVSMNFWPIAETNILVISNKFYNFNHAFGCSTSSDSSNGVCNGLFILGNTFDGMDGYAHSQSGDLNFHRNPVFLFEESRDYSGFVTNCVVAGNYFNMGIAPCLTNANRSAGTSAIFLDAYYAKQMRGFKIYNNIFKHAPGITEGNGFINNAGWNGLIANNIFIGEGIGVQGGSNCLILNNIFFTNSTAIVETIGSGDLGNEALYINSDYNAYWLVGGMKLDTFRYYTATSPMFIFNELLTTTGGGVGRHSRFYDNGGNYIFDVRWQQAQFEPDDVVTGSSSGLTVAISSFVNESSREADYVLWKAMTGNDAQSITNNPLLNTTTWQPATNSPAIGAGTNLYALGITNDFYGTARPAAGSWTIGPILAGSGSPPPDPPAGRILRVGTLRVGTLRGPL